MPDEYVVPCPHCKHLVRVPADYLGRVVSCLECQSPFRAPVNDGHGLTEPIPLAKSRGVPVKLFVPLFGLLMLGVAGLALNLFLLTDKDAATRFYANTLMELFPKEPPEAADWKAADAKTKPDDAEMRRREAIVEAFRRNQEAKLNQLPPPTALRYYGLATSGLTFLGGLAFLLRRGYPVAFLGCAAVAVLSPDLACCFVGVIIAIWGVLALVSDEGRRYFRKSR